MNCAETIREITRKHITENKGVVLCQALTAAGWVGNTVPELPDHPNLVELSIEDTSNPGLVVGYALAGRRPIYICRYQGFMWYNASPFINYAAKAKEMWGYSVPVFIRAISMEGGIGPVASNSHHGMITRMPGIKVYAPMTPAEYQAGWDYFMEHDGPFYCSEHRRSFKIDYEMPDIIHPLADITLFPISAARLEALVAVKRLEQAGIICNVLHLVWLKPFEDLRRGLVFLEKSTFGGVIIDTDYENGVSKCLAHDLMMQSSKRVRVLGLEERTAGFAPHLDNLPPSPEKIFEYVRNIINS
ncbi:MAG: hypothetical protein Q8Q89_01645 [bacterium]|nr:hypothetical protein [bacterium]